MTTEEKKKPSDGDVLSDLLEDAELDRIALEVNAASDDELRAELAKEGYGPEKIEAIFAGHAKVMHEGASAVKPTRRKALGRIGYAGGGFVGGFAVAAMVASIYIPAHEGPTTDPVLTAAAPPRTHADDLRDAAFKACATRHWQRCLELFDKAKEEDPNGDAVADVKDARNAAHEGLR